MEWWKSEKAGDEGKVPGPEEDSYSMWKDSPRYRRKVDAKREVVVVNRNSA